MLSRLGQEEEAVIAAETAIACGNRNPAVLNYAARVRAASTDPRLRDAARAVEFARAAVAAAPGEAGVHNTLGIALCRTKEWPEALKALDRSAELSNGGDAHDWYFAAIAHWKLGRADKARAWYVRAVEWAERHAPSDEELGRFRQEAAELLGVAEERRPSER